MQVDVLGAERRRRLSYDEKVRLVEETLQPGETGPRYRASSRSRRDHACGGSDLERRFTIGVVIACAA